MGPSRARTSTASTAAPLVGVAPAFRPRCLRLLSQTTYTGVYARGGPTNVDADPSNLGELQGAALVRGLHRAQAAPATEQAVRVTEGRT